MNVSLCIFLVMTAAALSASPVMAQEVYRCGNSYSSTPCPGAKSIDVTPAVINPDGPLTKFIYLCKRPDMDELWWISSTCESNGWTIVDKAKVPTNVDWNTQYSIAKRQRADAMRRAHTPRSWQSQQNTVQQQAPSSCETLDERIKWIDSAARAGGSIKRMEWLRQERQSARDQQFRDGC